MFFGSTSFWCEWNARICELIREELKEESERNNEKIQQIRYLMQKYEIEENRLLSK